MFESPEKLNFPGGVSPIYGLYKAYILWANANVVKPIITHPQSHHFLRVGFQPSPVMVGSLHWVNPTLMVINGVFMVYIWFIYGDKW